jgi:glycosyltransferase involved in cell wall biosynthesis
MNIVFLTLSRFTDISDRGIYPDLVRKFCKEGHNVYVVSPMERKFKRRTTMIMQENLNILKIRTLNIQKTSNIEKGIAYLMLEYQFIYGIRNYFSDVKFDLILYSTPPITFSRVVRFLKNRDKARSYLLLKDIFPQAAVDSGLIRKGGLTYQFFRKAEKDLYELSDSIGCMSVANIHYILSKNPEIPVEKVELNPNSIEPVEINVTELEKSEFRKKYNIPANAVIFVYGGNLGKSQGLEFFLDVMNAVADDSRIFFITVGSGSEFEFIHSFLRDKKLRNSILIEELSKDEYSKLLACCDVGLIFLSGKFTIPNFPSRLLSYMECKKPVLAATDSVTDIGKIISNQGFGYWVLHGDLEGFLQKMELLISDRQNNHKMGLKGHQYLVDNYTVEYSYSAIMKHFCGFSIDDKKITKKAENTIVFINQSSGYLMIDIVNAFEDIFEKRVLMAGLLNKRNKPLQDQVKIAKLVPYKRNSSVNRLFTWPWSFLQALVLIKFRYRKARLFLVSNPPFTTLLPLFCKNPFYLLIYDVYPDALVEFNYFSKNSLVVKLWKKANRRIFPKADRIFTLTEGMKAVLEKYAGEKEIEVIPIWTDNEFLKPVRKSDNPFVRKYNLMDKFVVMYSGNISTSQNIETLVELAGIMQREDLIFVIIGQGNQKDKIEKMISSLNLTNCLLLPWQETKDFPFSIAAADLAVISLGKEASQLAIPSKFYNFLSVGTPMLCITNNESDLGKLVIKYDVGSCFEPEMKQEMKTYIEFLIENPSVREELSKNSLAASKDFTSENVSRFF